MRLQLSFHSQNRNQYLPLHCQAQLSAWVMQTMQLCPGAERVWHTSAHGRVLPPVVGSYSFSQLQLQGIKTTYGQAGLQVESETVCLTIGFAQAETAGQFITGLKMRPQMRLSGGGAGQDAVFTLTSIQTQDLPAFRRRMVYRTLSPITLSVKKLEGGKVRTHTPDWASDEFANGFAHALSARHRIQTGQHILPDQIRFRLLSAPHSHLLSLPLPGGATSHQRGMACRFELVAPPAVQRTGFLAGFGEKNAQGFGCADVVENFGLAIPAWQRETLGATA